MNENQDEDEGNSRLIISELIDLLNDERSKHDSTIVTEIIKTIHLLVKDGGQRKQEVIHHPQLLIDLAKSFDIDPHVTRLFVSLLHDLSMDENGIRLLLSTGLIPILLQLSESSSDDIINFVLTTLRHCLITLPVQSAEEIQLHNGCLIFISLLLHRHSNRQMNFLADCLLRLALFNTQAQIYLQTSKLFVQELVTILDETNYKKLSVTLIRMLPFLSSNVTTKSMLIQFNLISILERIIKVHDNVKVQRYCLLTLRNLSDQILHLENFDSLIVTLIRMFATSDDSQVKLYIVDILSNLSCENQSNKSLMIEENVIPLLSDVVIQPNLRDEIIESAICTLRHLTGKCQLANEVRDDVHLHSVIPFLTKYLHTKQENWSFLKAVIGLIRNLALSWKNLSVLCDYRTVLKIGQIFLKMKSHNDRHELFLSTLFVFSRQHDEKYQRIIADDIIHSGSLPLIVMCASTKDLQRISPMAQTILDDLYRSDHHEVVRAAEKSRKIEQFLRE